MRMCLAGAALWADARSGRVPDPCKASKFTALAFRGVKIRAGVLENGTSSPQIGPEGDKLTVQKIPL
mgnify:FL=1